MNRQVALVTDSTADIPDTLVQQYDIEIVPQTLVWGSELYLDHVEMPAETFYERLEIVSAHPKTSQPTPHTFLEAFTRAVASGAQEIVAILLSGEMSGTLQSARQAAEMVSVPVHIVDSRSVTAGLGFQVLAAARAREICGQAAQDVATQMVQAARSVQEKIKLFVAMDTLKYLRLGGRIGHATAFIGGLLHIKPLVQVACTTGMVEPVRRVRSRARVIEALYQSFLQELGSTKRLHVAVLHGNAIQDAEALADRIREACHPVELFINTTGPVLGVHTGPAALALAGYPE